MAWYRKRDRVTVSFDQEKGLTKQAFAEETNVNAIMAKYQATGQFTHLNHNPAVYGDFSEVKTLQEAIEKVEKAKEIFLSLPSETRSRFNHNVADFVKHSQGASLEELHDLGVIVEAPQQRDPELTQSAPEPQQPPAEAPTEQSTS